MVQLCSGKCGLCFHQLVPLTHRSGWRLLSQASRFLLLNHALRGKEKVLVFNLGTMVPLNIWNFNPEVAFYAFTLEGKETMEMHLR